MVPNVGSSKLRLAYLQDIHGDLLRKMAALATLRKQVERREEALHAKVASRNQLRQKQMAKTGDPSHVQHRTAG